MVAHPTPLKQHPNPPTPTHTNQDHALRGARLQPGGVHPLGLVAKRVQPAICRALFKVAQQLGAVPWVGVSVCGGGG